MKKVYNALHLAELKSRFDCIMGQVVCGDEKNNDPLEEEYLKELFYDSFFAYHSNISSALHICYGKSKFIYRLLANRKDLSITLFDMRGEISVALNDRIELLSSGKGSQNCLVFFETLLNKRRFEAVIIESAMQYSGFVEDKKFFFRKLFTVLIPGGSLWITNDLAVNGEKTVNRRGQYLDYIENMRRPNHKTDTMDLNGEKLNFSLFNLLTELKNIGFQRVELIYMHFGSMALGV